MKKNKMLLGAALLAFAVSSAFVTKAANHERATTVFYIDNDTGLCTKTTTNQTCPTGGSGCVQDVNPDNPSAQLYASEDANGNCQNELKSGNQ